MIFGIGTDIVEIARIEKAIQNSERFAVRLLTEFEYGEFTKSKQASRYLAKKFAAKEAFVKAMGTGIGNGISWQMIQIEHDVLGKPFVTLLAEAQNFVDKNAISAWHISISDEQNYATATAIIEC
jgi:holo-[acyl-carrier protein] synthase